LLSFIVDVHSWKVTGAMIVNKLNQMVSIKDIKFIAPVLFYMAIAKGFTYY